MIAVRTRNTELLFRAHTLLLQQAHIEGEETMAEGFTIAHFKHVADGLQEGQFSVGERQHAASLADLDPMYRDLLDRPITVTLAVMGPDGRPSLTPMWFDYEGDTILVNTASHRNKCDWIRRNPHLSILIVNPDNPYHWISLKCTVVNEIHEDDPGGERATAQVNKIWSKYTGEAPVIRNYFVSPESRVIRRLSAMNPIDLHCSKQTRYPAL